MGEMKELNIKNETYYFCDDTINIKIFQSNLLKIDKKNHIKTLIFTILVTLLLKNLINLLIMKIFIA